MIAFIEIVNERSLHELLLNEDSFRFLLGCMTTAVIMIMGLRMSLIMMMMHIMLAVLCMMIRLRWSQVLLAFIETLFMGICCIIEKMCG
jgi:hypothetical protein